MLQPSSRAMSGGGWADTVEHLGDIRIFPTSAIPAAIDWSESILLQERILSAGNLRQIRRSSKRLVFDFSDPIHVSTGIKAGVRRAVHRVRVIPRFESTIQTANDLIVENDIIASGLRDGGHRVSVIRGPVDPDRFRPRQHALDATEGASGMSLGWTGSPSTYRFMRELLPVIDDVGSASRINLTIIGGVGAPTLRNVPVHAKAWEMVSEPGEVASWDVGLFYQPSSKWTEIRGGGKIPQYMASGVAIVASRAGIGGQLIEHGKNGLLAGSMEEWRSVLSLLAGDPELRTAVAAQARQDAVRHHSYEATLPVVVRALGIDA